MPISVLCPGCKARFTVNEKFAGKKGPCPRCKTVITIPDVPAEEVKIHAPEQFAHGGKDAKGRPVLKPIARKETKIEPVAVAAIVGAVLVVLVVAWLLRSVHNKLPIIAAGLVILSPPVAAAAYTFLRDDELEGYKGRSLWLRATLCGLAYAALWGAYLPLAGYMTGEAYQWVFVAPVFISLGGAAAWACFDLDFGSGALHYSFYLLVTIGLRFVLGMPPIWSTSLA